MTLKQHNDQIFEHNVPNPTPDTRQGWAQPCSSSSSSSSSSSLERETWKRGRVEPPDTNYKALKNLRSFRQSTKTQAIHLAFITVEKTEISKNTCIFNQTREVNEINWGHRCITGRLFWISTRNGSLCPQASNETSHRIEKPAIFKNIYKHEPLAILEL